MYYYWNKDRHIYQWNRSEIIEIKQYIYGQLMFNKSTKIIQGGKNSLSKNGGRKTRHPNAK